MKNIFKILFLTSTLPLVACEYSQPPATVEYHLEDVYSYGDVQGPPTAGSPEEIAMRDKGVPVVIEDISEDTNQDITEENTETATQVYKVSDKVGPKPPKKQKLVRNPVTSDASEVNISGKTHIVAAGETLFSISRRYDVPILPIIVANRLEQPYAVTTGQKIKIPEGKFHKVADGETLYSISRQYGVDMSGIVKLNELHQPYNVVKGQTLQIPFPSDLPSEEALEESGEALAEAPVEPTSVYSTSADDEGKPASMRKGSSGVLGSYNQPAAAPKIDTEIENVKLAEKTTTEIKTAATETKKPVSSGSEFIWPVNGKVIKRFGQQGGEYNDGINISASAGSQVKASNAGRVVYTGSSLKSYGNLVIIKHDNGLLSAYAHMSGINVKKDQEISKGQTIGAVGSTGKVTSPQLYFAVRKGKDARDPMKYLK